jgi:hypothetical protein
MSDLSFFRHLNVFFSEPWPIGRKPLCDEKDDRSRNVGRRTTHSQRVTTQIRDAGS